MSINLLHFIRFAYRKPTLSSYGLSVCHCNWCGKCYHVQNCFGSERQTSNSADLRHDSETKKIVNMGSSESNTILCFRKIFLKYVEYRVKPLIAIQVAMIACIASKG